MMLDKSNGTLMKEVPRETLKTKFTTDASLSSLNNNGILSTRVGRKILQSPEVISTGSQHLSPSYLDTEEEEENENFDLEADESCIEEASESRQQSSVASVMNIQKTLNTKFAKTLTQGVGVSNYQ